MNEKELLRWLKKNYRNTDNKVICKMTGLTVGQVKYAARKAGVSKALTKREEKYLTRHYSNTLNSELSERLGVSIQKVKHYARLNGLKKTKEFRGSIVRNQNSKPITKEQLEWLRLHFATMRNKDIAEHIGRCKGDVSRIAGRMGLKKDAEFLRMAPSKTMAKLRAKEKARLTFGLPQQTKIKVHKQSSTRYNQRMYLKRRGYMIDEEERVAYWDDKTQRATRMEKKNDGVYEYACIDELMDEYHEEFRKEREEYMKRRKENKERRHEMYLKGLETKRKKLLTKNK